MTNSENMNSKYLLFFFIGIFTFFLNGYALSGIHPPHQFDLMFVIYGVLFAGGLLFSREMSSVFILKAFAVSFTALLLISAAFFALGAFSHENSKSMGADKLEFAPDEFVIVTEEELDEYPELKRAIESPGGYFSVDSEEWERTSDFLREKGDYEIKVGNDYYIVYFMTA